MSPSLKRVSKFETCQQVWNVSTSLKRVSKFETCHQVWNVSPSLKRVSSLKRVNKFETCHQLPSIFSLSQQKTVRFNKRKFRLKNVLVDEVSLNFEIKFWSKVKKFIVYLFQLRILHIENFYISFNDLYIYKYHINIIRKMYFFIKFILVWQNIWQTSLQV